MFYELVWPCLAHEDQEAEEGRGGLKEADKVRVCSCLIRYDNILSHASARHRESWAPLKAGFQALVGEKSSFLGEFMPKESYPTCW